MASLQVFLFFLPRAPKFPLPFLTPATQAKEELTFRVFRLFRRAKVSVKRVKGSDTRMKKDGERGKMYRVIFFCVSPIERVWRSPLPSS